MPVSEETKKLKSKAKASLTLLLVAVISISTATYAWFTLSNSTSVQEMVVQVATGTLLRVRPNYLGYTDDIDQYYTELTTEQVNATLQHDFSYKLEDIRLWPLTSGNGYDLYTESVNTVPAKRGDGSAPSTRYYLELDLWFMSNSTMHVYLNADDSPDNTIKGTSVTSAATNSAAQQPVQEAARISFTSYQGQGTDVEQVRIYEPNRNVATNLTGNALADNNNTAAQVTFVELGNNAGTGTENGTAAPVLFDLQKDVPKHVVIRLWIEGEDPQCVNGVNSVDISKAKLETRLRFCGADDAGNIIEGSADT